MDIGVNNTRYTLSVEDAVDCLVTRDSYLAYALVLCIIDANKSIVNISILISIN